MFYFSQCFKSGFLPVLGGGRIHLWPFFLLRPSISFGQMHPLLSVHFLWPGPFWSATFPYSVHSEIQYLSSPQNMRTILFKFNRYSFICQGTSTRRQRRDLFGLRVKLPPVTTSLTTQSRGNPVKCLPCPRTQQANLPAYLRTIPFL